MAAAHHAIGDLHACNDAPRAAINVYRKALSIDPTFVDGWLALGAGGLKRGHSTFHSVVSGRISWLTHAHDLAGNMTTLPQADDPTLLSELTYDAWNRLVSVYDADSHSERTKNEYDGLHLRRRPSR